MFLPIKDMNPTERFPFVTIAIIVANVLVFIYELLLGSRVNTFIAAYGAIPYEITNFTDIVGRDPNAPIMHVPGPPIAALTLVTSMFIHGGFMHIIGNMLYLWIFGNNIEDLIGPARFAFFYLATGLIAGLVHVAISPNSTIPTVGASGAVSGVLGAYLVAYPHARVLTVVFLFIFIRIIMVPAGILLAFWFAIQAFSGFSSVFAGMSGGVAWWAHIGGFVAGIILIWLMAGTRIRWLRSGGGE